MQKGATSVAVWQFLKNINIELLCHQVILLVGIHPVKTEKICPHKYLYMNVHSLITNSHKLEAIQLMNGF